jgi:hypothetical protein
MGHLHRRVWKRGRPDRNLTTTVGQGRDRTRVHCDGRTGCAAPALGTRMGPGRERGAVRVRAGGDGSGMIHEDERMVDA